MAAPSSSRPPAGAKSGPPAQKKDEKKAAVPAVAFQTAVAEANLDPARIALARELMADNALMGVIARGVMVPGRHYGTVGGDTKPTLLKAGAELLNRTFKLYGEFELVNEPTTTPPIRYIVRCFLKRVADGMIVATGIGSANSYETKYRYRWAALKDDEGNVRPVPKEYWDKGKDPAVLVPIFKRQGLAVRKVDGLWCVCERVENDNPLDLDNTLLKMAEKRALVAATLNATAASEYFTQDLEDMPKGVGGLDMDDKQNATPATSPYEALAYDLAEARDIPALEAVVARIIAARDKGELSPDELEDLRARKSAKETVLKREAAPPASQPPADGKLL